MTEITVKPQVETPGNAVPSHETSVPIPAREMIRVAKDIELKWKGDRRFDEAYAKNLSQVNEILKALQEGTVTQEEAAGVLATQIAEQQMAAEKDSTTDTFNRLAAELLLAQSIAISRRNGRPIAVALLDLDRFHDVNEIIGHPGGDAVLRAFAEHVKTGLRRETDILCRWGGEEFLLIMPNTDEEGAKETLERIRESAPGVIGEAVDNQGFLLTRDVTFSGGLISAAIGTQDPREAEVIGNDMVKTADDRLYAAKSNGRNQIVGSAENNG